MFPHLPKIPLVLCVPILLLTAACTTPDPQEPPDDPKPVDPGDFDCSTVPDVLPDEATIEGARAYKGLAFDGEGNLVGNDESSLIKASYDGDWRVFVPGVGTVEGMIYLPGGDLIVTTSWDSGHMRRVTPEGGISTLVSGLMAYSVILGPDGMLYAAGWNGAYRVDPDTGAVDTLIETGWDEPWSARTLAFSTALDRLYIGTVDDRGRIFYWDLDEDLRIVGDPKVFVEDVGNGWHDGLGMDICGNLWAVDFESASLYRISPEGEVRTMADWSDNEDRFGHGLAWGSGLGGWRDDALYFPMPEAGNTVKEIVVGVPAADYP